MLERPLLSQKCFTSCAIARYVMGRQCGDEPWLRRSCVTLEGTQTTQFPDPLTNAYIGLFASLTNAFASESQFRFDPLENTGRRYVVLPERKI